MEIPRKTRRTASKVNLHWIESELQKKWILSYFFSNFTCMELKVQYIIAQSEFFNAKCKFAFICCNIDEGEITILTLKFEWLVKFQLIFWISSFLCHHNFLVCRYVLVSNSKLIRPFTLHILRFVSSSTFSKIRSAVKWDLNRDATGHCTPNTGTWNFSVADVKIDFSSDSISQLVPTWHFRFCYWQPLSLL